jgi:hypothetical protein
MEIPFGNQTWLAWKVSAQISPGMTRPSTETQYVGKWWGLVDVFGIDGKINSSSLETLFLMGICFVFSTWLCNMWFVKNFRYKPTEFPLPKPWHQDPTAPRCDVDRAFRRFCISWRRIFPHRCREAKPCSPSAHKTVGISGRDLAGGDFNRQHFQKMGRSTNSNDTPVI